MIYVVYFVHIVTCLFLILVVLLQQGKGADLSVFGGGATQTAFGARSAATLLHKLTVTFFVLFILTTLTIGILQRGATDSSVFSDAEEPASATPASSTDDDAASGSAAASEDGAAVPAADAAETPDGAAAETTGATDPAPTEGSEN